MTLSATKAPARAPARSGGTSPIVDRRAELDAGGARAPVGGQLHHGDTFEAAGARTDPRLTRIATAKLRGGPDHSCVTTVRRNLARLGFSGLPEATGNDRNNPRGMMVQMLQSGYWRSESIPGAQPQTIKSPYGAAQANVLSRDAFNAAAAAGQIPDGAVVFQTRHDWSYGRGSLGNDVGIVQNGRLFNSQRMQGLEAYGAESNHFVVLVPG